MTEQITRHLDLPLQVAGLVVGKKGIKINTIKQRSKAHVELAPEPLESNDRLKRLTMKGYPGDVAKAEEMIVDLLSKWCSGDARDNLELLPRPLRGKVLEYMDNAPSYSERQQSQSNRPTQQYSQGQQQTHSQHPRQVLHQQQQQQQQQQLQGQGQAPQQARMQAQQPADSFGDMGRVDDKMLQRREELDVPTNCMYILASHNGQQIASIEAMSCAKISYTERQPEPSTGMTRIAIAGEQQAVVQARQMFVQVVNRLHMQLAEQRAQYQAQYAEHSLPPSHHQPQVLQPHGAQAQAQISQPSAMPLPMQGAGGLSPSLPSIIVAPHQQGIPFSVHQHGLGGTMGASSGVMHGHAALPQQSIQIPLPQQLLHSQQGQAPQQGQPPQQLHPPLGVLAGAERARVPAAANDFDPMSGQIPAQQQPPMQQQPPQQPQQPPQPPQQQPPQQPPQQQPQVELEDPLLGGPSAQAANDVATEHLPEGSVGSVWTDDNSGILRAELMVPAGAGGMIVGKKAAQIKKFRQECGAKVSVKQDPPTSDANIKIVVLEGSMQSVQKALQMLSETLALWSANDPEAGQLAQRPAEYWMEYLTNQQMRKRGGGGRRAAEEDLTERELEGAPSAVVRLEMKIPVAAAGLVVGKGGKTIKGVKLRTGANVSLAPEPVSGDSSLKVLSVQGSKRQVVQARENLQEIMMSWLRNLPEAEGGGPAATVANLRAVIQEQLVLVRPPAQANHAAPTATLPQRAAAKPPMEDQSQPNPAGGAQFPRRMEMLVTVAAAAMIIGKKGIMLKLLQNKSGAKISLDQLPMADGRKRVVIEGTLETVAQAHRYVEDMVGQCDDAKYEEAARRRAQEEEGRRRAQEEEARKRADAKQAQEAARQEAEEAVKREERKREEEERRWLEKKAKAAQELEEKRRLQAKIHANPFAFLDDDDDGDDDDDDEEEEEEETQVNSSPKTGKSARRRKKKGGAGGGEQGPNSGGSTANSASGKAAEAVKAAEAKEEEDDDEDESPDSSDEGENGDGKIGLDRLLEGLQSELEPEERQMQFAASPATHPTAPLLRLDVGSLSRRGMLHANEDRLHIVEFTELLSEAAQAALLAGCSSKSMPLFVVLDGHGGAGCAEAASKQLPANIARALEERIAAKGVSGVEACAEIPEAMVDGFARTEEQAKEQFERQGDKSGACAVCVLKCEAQQQHVLHIANLGDCRAVLGRIEGQKMLPVRLTSDHRATVASERSRIEAAGGKVVDKRALGELIPSRSLGDMKTKQKCPGAIIATPEVSNHVLTGNDAWLVLASDGLWDDMKLDKVMEHLNKARSPDAAAQNIAKGVIKKYGTKNTKPNDDLTVVAVSMAWA